MDMLGNPEELKKKALEEATKKAVDALPWHMKFAYTWCSCCMPKLEVPGF
jgi:hypothetical protein